MSSPECLKVFRTARNTSFLGVYLRQKSCFFLSMQLYEHVPVSPIYGVKSWEYRRIFLMRYLMMCLALPFSRIIFLCNLMLASWLLERKFSVENHRYSPCFCFKHKLRVLVRTASIRRNWEQHRWTSYKFVLMYWGQDPPLPGFEGHIKVVHMYCT